MNLPLAAAALTGLYIFDRAAKAALVARFFARPALPALENWPTFALIQPVTRGAAQLAENLSARAALDYPGTIQHLVVCDAGDAVSQAVCRTALPGVPILTVEPDNPRAQIASKVAKMTAGVKKIDNADIICFIDDDILLPPDALQVLIAPLYARAPAGATFGLACQASWETLASSLMSGFVNANALTGYVPLTFFTEPYTITGHVFALRRGVFEQAGGMAGLEGRFDDDHEIARRVRAMGLPIVQTALVYRVANTLPTLASYHEQLRRWFVMPRQAMLPFLTVGESVVSGLLSVGNLLPPAVLLCALFAPSSTTFACAALTFLAFLGCYATLEARYLPARTPAHRLWILPFVVFLTPLHVLLALMLPGDQIQWRGQSYHARRGGKLDADE